MSFIFKCPYCQQAMNCEDAWDGLKAQCPQCGKDTILRKQPVPMPSAGGCLPSTQPVAAPSGGASMPQAPAQPVNEVPSEPDFLFICPECGSPAILPADKQGKNYTCQFCSEDVIALPSSTRKCPSCGETIKIAAAICKYCHKPVPPVMPQSPTATQNVASPGSGPSVDPAGNAGSAWNGGMAASLALPTLPINNIYLRREVASLWKFTKCWMICFFSSSVAGSILGMLGSMVHELFMVLAIPAIIFALVSVIFLLIKFIKLFYRYWAYVGTGSNRTPGQMVGFCFIPFFNYYWQFVAIWGLAKRLKKGGCGNVNPALSLVLCIINCCTVINWIPGLGQALNIAMLVFFLIVFAQFDTAFTGGNSD
ncbi:MAG: hypothetical protein II943_04325 [Victivallales bacterium]|nr:hypothetical protein [Victivallales bacterium]